MKHIAVVGCGQWGKNLVRNLGEMGVLGVACDVDSTKLAGIQERYPHLRISSSFVGVLRDDDIPRIMIATVASSRLEKHSHEPNKSNQHHQSDQPDPSRGGGGPQIANRKPDPIPSRPHPVPGTCFVILKPYCFKVPFGFLRSLD